MKKVESVVNDYLACGKPGTLSTFPRILFSLNSLILPKKFTIKEGEGTISTLKAPAELIPGRRKGLSLTLP
jgi:hypothetical protein